MLRTRTPFNGKAKNSFILMGIKLMVSFGIALGENLALIHRCLTIVGYNTIRHVSYLIGGKPGGNRQAIWLAFEERMRAVPN